MRAVPFMQTIGAVLSASRVVSFLTPGGEPDAVNGLPVALVVAPTAELDFLCGV